MSVHDGRPVDALLSDGRVVRLRAFVPADRDAVLRLHEEASEESRYLRFFTSGTRSARLYVEHLCERDPGPGAIVAIHEGRIVGLATAEPLAAHRAEVSFFIADDVAGCGVATLLLEHLAAGARRDGVLELVAEVLATNRGMLRVLLDAGFDRTESLDGDVVRVTMSTAAVSRALDAAFTRECEAEAASLACLRDPRSVAVIGVRRDGTGVGGAVLDAIRAGGYEGALWVIHPQLAAVDGVVAYPALSAAPAPADVVIIAAPAAGVPAIVEDAGRAGARCAVIISSGFAEDGVEGARLQHLITASARSHGMRLIGPNCFGISRFSADVRLDATFAASSPLPGGFAVATQSGGVGIAVRKAAGSLGLGMSAFVSLGNKADVSGNDLLAAWSEDDDISVAGLYLESFGNPQKFAWLARRFTAKKPILAIVGGRTAAGGRATASHTAAATTPAVAARAMLEHAGVIVVDDIEDMVATAALLTNGDAPRGRRLGIIGNAGGLGVLAADQTAEGQVTVPHLSEMLRREARTSLGTSAVGNPVDLGAGATPERFAAGVRLLGTSDEVDAVIVFFAGTRAVDDRSVFDAIREASRAVPVPVLVVAYDVRAGLREEFGAHVAMVPSGVSAVRAVDFAARHRETRSLEREPVDESVPSGASEGSRTARDLLAGGSSGGEHDRWLSPDEINTLFEAGGVQRVVGVVARGREAAGDAASAVGFPVVMKSADPRVRHKSDRGLVRVGIRDRAGVASVADAFARELGGDEAAVLIQPIVEGGVEVALGIVRDPSFGPLVMLAAGGVDIDVWDDRAFLVPPFGPSEVERALDHLRISTLLRGHRARPGVDLPALIELCCAVGRLAQQVPEIAELDINPVIADWQGVTLVDARVRLVSVDHPSDDIWVPQLSPA